METGLWAVWYDLPETKTTEYLDWAHDLLMPRLAARPDCLWAAHYRNIGYQDRELSTYIRSRGVSAEDAPGLGRGTQFLMIAEWSSLSAALREGPTGSGASPEAGAMLALRDGLRSGLFVELAHVEGPDASAGASVGPPLIQFGSIRARHFEHEVEVLKWYEGKRLPDAACVPGLLRARQLFCASGWAKFGIIYEFASFAAHQRYFEPRLERGGMDEAWTRRVVDGLLHAPGSPTVAERLWPPVET